MKKFRVFWLFLVVEALFSQALVVSFSSAGYEFTVSGKGQEDSKGVIELVRKPEDIDQVKAKRVLVESFIGEYSKYLEPSEIGNGLSSWRDGSTPLDGDRPAGEKRR